jgi:hypothetical protein
MSSLIIQNYRKSLCEQKVDLKIKDYFSYYRKFGHSIFFPFTFHMDKSYQEATLVSQKLKVPASWNEDEELFLINLIFEVQFQENYVLVNIGSRTVNLFELRPTFDLDAQIVMPGVETLVYKDNCSRVQLKILRGWFECCIMAYLASDGSVKLPVHFQIKNFSPKNSVSLEEYEAHLGMRSFHEKYDWKLKRNACSVSLRRSFIKKKSKKESK